MVVPGSIQSVGNQQRLEESTSPQISNASDGLETCPNQRLKVLFLNRSYWPDAEATGQLLTELCEDLVERFDVTVLAGQPNQNPRNETFRISGRELHHGVTIERIRHPQWGKRYLAARAANLVGFLLSAAGNVFWLPRHDVVITETDPFLMPLLARKLKWWHKSRLVIYLQDLYPDVAVALEKVREGLLTKFLRSRLKAAYQCADLIIVLSGDMKRRLIDWGLEPAKIHCIENWVDTTAVVPLKSENPVRERENLNDHFVVMHSGNMGLSQNLINVVEAAALLQKQTEIDILFVGGGADKPNLESRSNQLQLKNLRFLPYQPREELAQSLSAADVHLISMHPEAHHCLMPSKLYGILASGTPSIVIASPDSELAKLVREHGIGFVIPPGDPQALANQIVWCANHRDELVEMGRRARAVAVENYDRKHQTERFGKLISEAFCATNCKSL